MEGLASPSAPGPDAVSAPVQAPEREQAKRLIPVMRPWMGVEEAEAAAAAVWSGWVAQGPRVAEFEAALKGRVGAAHAVALSSCTAALHLAYVLQDIGPGDEVVLPSLTFIACANSVVQVGATPVFADVDAATLNISPETIEPVLSPRTRVVLAVHQAGVPADIDGIHSLCDPRGISVVEDAACAIGSTYQGQAIGSHSDLVAFSFHPRKLVTTGEGGMLTTSRPDWDARLRRLREHGSSVSAAHRHLSPAPVMESYPETGFNYRMTDIQAAVGLVQLGRLNDMVARRRHLAFAYGERLDEIEGIRWIADPPYGTSNFQSFWVELPASIHRRRDQVMQHMLEQGVSTRRGIMASHLEPAYAGRHQRPLPATERLARSALILPLFHEMSEDDLDQVVEALRTAISGPAG
jgi:dTDP-4-amino-4,6-dideoxygalactose transaminase